ncbi:MAG: acyl-CoA dehydrogenase family protein, partial [Microbacteriaceae bacterium]
MANGDYTAPVADYAFLLKEVFGTDIVARSTEGAMTADDMLDAIEAGGEMASEVFAPLDRNGDVQGAKLVDGNVQTPDGFKEAYATYVEAGWVSAGSPESAGGDGLPSSVQGALSEFWSAANSAFSLAAGLSAGAINSINTYGSQEIKDTYLPKLVSGEWTGTMNLTEPQAGTDLGAITTIARDNGDGSYSISGQKIFITWGDHDVAENIIHLVLARTEGAPEGHRGLSLFVAPKFLLNADGTPGERNNIVTVSLEDKLGIHGSPTAQLQYENATGYLVGELHQGLQGMFVMMNDSRINIGIQGLGIAD